MRKYIVFLLIVLSFNLFYLNVYAEGEETATCTGREINTLNKMAAKVNASYEIKQKEDGTNYFLISIYNLSEGVSANVVSNYIVDSKNTASSAKIDEVLVTYEQSNSGTYTFEVTNTDSVIQYTIEVVLTKDGCENGTYKTIKVVKPRYNNLSELSICNRDEVKDYMYCEEWTTKWFNLTKEEIIDKINKQYNAKTTTTTTQCYTCIDQENREAELKKQKRIKVAIILGLISGMIVDIFYISYTIWKMKRYDI